MGAARASTGGRLDQVADEIAWDLLRDEWELLMAVGSGPTSADVAAERAGEAADAVRPRLELLVSHGLLKRVDDGFSLVAAEHSRMEGMSSYVRDLVLRRIEVGGPPPVAARVRFDVGGAGNLENIVDRAEDELFPVVAAKASVPESDRSERFLLVLALTANCEPPEAVELDAEGVVHGSELVPQVLRVVRGAAIERARSNTSQSAKLWIAEMMVDPEIAFEIVEDVQSFMGAVPQVSGTGAAAFGVWPVANRAAHAGGAKG